MRVVPAPIIALIVTAAGPAAAQTSCEVLVGRGVVAVYAASPSDLTGDLCIERQCEALTVRKGWATDHRKVEAGDLVYFRPATGEKPCVGAAPVASAWLPQAMPAFISGALGLMAALLGMAGAFSIEAVKFRREASAKALDWLETYGSRLDDVIRDARADPTPPPLPAAGSKVLAELRRRRRSASAIMAGLASDAPRQVRVETAERAKAILAADFKV